MPPVRRLLPDTSAWDKSHDWPRVLRLESQRTRKESDLKAKHIVNIVLLSSLMLMGKCNPHGHGAPVTVQHPR